MSTARAAEALTGDQNYDRALSTNVEKGWSAYWRERVGALGGDIRNDLNAEQRCQKRWEC